MKQRIARAFGGADAYDRYAGVQKQVAQRLAQMIRSLRLPGRPRVLEVGCGTGFLAEASRSSFSEVDWLMTDIAPEMVERCRSRLDARDGYRFAVLDGEDPRLPPGEGPFDLVCSSLAAQWFDDLEAGLTRLFQMLAPGGHLLVATLAAGSFAEWRQAHAELELSHGVRMYPGAAKLRAMKLNGNFGDVGLEWFKEHYPDGVTFLRALAGIGAGTPRSGHRPLDAAAMRKVLARFEKHGAIASYHVAFCRFASGAPSRAEHPPVLVAAALGEA